MFRCHLVTFCVAVIKAGNTFTKTVRSSTDKSVKALSTDWYRYLNRDGNCSFAADRKDWREGERGVFGLLTVYAHMGSRAQENCCSFAWTPKADRTRCPFWLLSTGDWWLPYFVATETLVWQVWNISKVFSNTWCVSGSLKFNGRLQCASKWTAIRRRSCAWWE